MVRAKKAKEIHIAVSNKVGTLSALMDVCAGHKINVHSFAGSAVEDIGLIRLVLWNASLAASLVKKLIKKGFAAKIKNVLLVECPNTQGSLAPVLKKCARAGIDIIYCYASSADGKTVSAVFSTCDDDKVLKLING